MKPVTSLDDRTEYMAQASEYAQRFLESFANKNPKNANMAAFDQVIVLLQAVIDSPFKVPTAALGIGLLCQEYAKSLLPRPDLDWEQEFEPNPIPVRDPKRIALANQFLAKAKKFYLIAAAMPEDTAYGAAHARLSLAQLYEEKLLPIPDGWTPNKLAFALVKEAAEAGCFDGQISLSDKYYVGRGVDASNEKAIYWCREAKKNLNQVDEARQQSWLNLIEDKLKNMEREESRRPPEKKLGNHNFEVPTP